MSRAANCEEVSTSDVQAIADRVAKANGLHFEDDLSCASFDDASLPGTAASEKIVLSSIGPLQNVDRLLGDQTLKFAEDGVTVIFGENGSGKSGYARALRRLCTARVPVQLKGDVFATGVLPPPAVVYAVRRGDSDPVEARWHEGDPTPAELADITFLDTENARVYVEGETEILYLPSEVRCLTRLGQLYSSAAQICESRAATLTGRYTLPFSGSFDSTSRAGSLVTNLTTATPLEDLPLEDEIRAAAEWKDENETALADLRVQLAQSPKNQAVRLRKLATAIGAVSKEVSSAVESLADKKLAEDSELRKSLQRAIETADTLAAEQISGQPIAETGSESWRQLFQFARKFAAEANVIPLNRGFEVGDPCPLCQRELDEAARDRLNAFDNFVKGEATAAVEAARNKIETRLQELHGLRILEPERVEAQLGDTAAGDTSVANLVAEVSDLCRALEARRTRAVEQLKRAPEETTAPLATECVEKLAELEQSLTTRADGLEKTEGVDEAAVKHEKELCDQKALYERLDEALARRNGLADRLRYLRCAQALNTRPVSLLASRMRGQLVTPELKRRIQAELTKLGLEYIPLRFHEASHSGRSFFEMALDTEYQNDKEAVLSEGEQRGLAMACFLADSHVAATKNAIIVDDPVNSLDHQRIRRVAERLVEEGAAGRQVIIFTHNVLFYQEVLRGCAEHSTPVPALPCLVQKSPTGFGLVTVNDQPWIAKKVKDRERALEAKLRAIPDDLPADSEEFRGLAKDFYTDLRETWERAVEEIVLGGVVERFGTDVKTQSLKLVEVTDDDYRIIFFNMKRVSERSGHDQAAGRQIDNPNKEQMEKDLLELRGFIGTRRKARQAVESRRKGLESAPAATVS